jgi:hypothetical protein
MPWYKTGSVSVTQNSNAVIGTGTAFIANSRVGDAFRGPDGGWYEVANIASNSAMSIDPPYQGATNAAGTYALAPMQGYVKESADRLRALVEQFGEQLAALIDTDGLPEGPMNKYFTDARARSVSLIGLMVNDTTAVVATDSVLIATGKLQAQATSASNAISSKAAKGVNQDITSLTGLTTALSISQGGTGGITAEQARNNLGLKSASIVDVVGTMTGGAIIERISNANGTCVRLRDGTQICTLSPRGLFVDMTSAVGAMYTHTGDFAIPGAFPAPFIESPSVSFGYRQMSWYGFATITADATASNWPNLKGFCLASVPGNAVYYSITAIGRWKV